VESRLQDEEKAMTCAICKGGDLVPGTTTVILQRGETTIIIKSVPADVCDNCGEYYLSEETTRRVLALAEVAVAQGAEIEVIRFAA
jgi:YgiT-type zinc finger domain-containing protein